MGSCLSKPSSKGHKKKKGEASLEGERDVRVKNKEPLKASGGEAEEEYKVEAVVPSVQAVRAASSPLLIQVAALPLSHSTESAESQVPPPSSSTQKLCASPSLSPDPVTLPFPAQTPMRKRHSGELPINSLRKPSSPCRAILYKMPSSPGGMKKSTYSQRNEEEDCKFPSLARKQWLSQACVTTKGSGEDDTLTMGSRENASKEKTLTSRETVNTVSNELSEQTSARLKQESDAKPMAHACKSLASEAPGLLSKTAASRTNSLSRDMSPVEHSRAKARPSSPLKRSPSIKDHVGGATDVPRLMRNSSGKVSSPNRAALHTVERHEPLKPRPLHKQSLSREYLTDPASDPSAHKRTSSRDSVSEFSAEIIRKPSPPKKTPVVVPSSMSLSSLDAGRLNAKRSSTPSKENFSSHKPVFQEPSSMAKGGKILAQRNLSTAVLESDSMATGSNNRNIKRKEKSPLRRTNGMGPLHSSARNSDRNADLSINSDATATTQVDLVGKDLAPRTRRPTCRTPLKEITDNSAKLLPSKAGAKESSGAALKARDVLPVHKGDDAQEHHFKEEATKGHTVLGKIDEKSMLDLPNNLNDYIKDPLEVKAENLVLEGKSVLSAFKALEEYRLKYSNLNSESHQGTVDDAWYSRPQPYTAEKENFSQPLKGADMENALSKPNPQPAQELPRSRSTKKSCEQFFFPDVQSLLMSDKEGLQLEGGMTMPASISKACSILRAVADLNNGMPVYPKRKEVQDEIERPNLLSFQFGEGDSDRVTLS